MLVQHGPWLFVYLGTGTHLLRANVHIVWRTKKINLTSYGFNYWRHGAIWWEKKILEEKFKACCPRWSQKVAGGDTGQTGKAELKGHSLPLKCQFVDEDEVVREELTDLQPVGYKPRCDEGITDPRNCSVHASFHSFAFRPSLHPFIHQVPAGHCFQEPMSSTPWNLDSDRRTALLSHIWKASEKKLSRGFLAMLGGGRGGRRCSNIEKSVQISLSFANAQTNNWRFHYG